MLLYAPSTSTSVPRSARTSRPLPTTAATGLAAAFAAAASSSATSCSVRNSRVAYFAGRSIGVVTRTSQMPWRSGSPHGVRGAAAGAAFCAAAGAWACCALTVMTRPTTATPTANAPIASNFRRVIENLRNDERGPSPLKRGLRYSMLQAVERVRRVRHIIRVIRA